MTIQNEAQDGTRPIGNTPITDAAAATAPDTSRGGASYGSAGGQNNEHLHDAEVGQGQDNRDDNDPIDYDPSRSSEQSGGPGGGQSGGMPGAGNPGGQMDEEDESYGSESDYPVAEEDDEDLDDEQDEATSSRPFGQ